MACACDNAKQASLPPLLMWAGLKGSGPLICLTMFLICASLLSGCSGAKPRRVGRIAFVSVRVADKTQRSLYVVNADGTGRKCLVKQGVEPQYGLAWSPDGTKIAFVWQRDHSREIHVINADGTGEKNLSPIPANDQYPAWSPGGSRIAFTSGNPPYGSIAFDICVMNPDGTGRSRLTQGPAGIGDSGPHWSPDEKRIAFSRHEQGNSEVYVMNADGSGQRNLTQSPRLDFCRGWSREGKKILFESNRTGNWDIYVMNADGRGQTNLTRNPADDSGPSWSPDGRKIAFTRRQQNASGEIYMMDADGTNQRRITTNPMWDVSPVWSPDGKMIAFLRLQQSGLWWFESRYSEIYVMNADGSDQRNITRMRAYTMGYAWAPR